MSAMCARLGAPSHATTCAIGASGMTYSIDTGTPTKPEEPSKSAVKPSRAAIYAKRWKRCVVTRLQIKVNQVHLPRNLPVTKLPVLMHL